MKALSAAGTRRPEQLDQRRHHHEAQPGRHHPENARKGRYAVSLMARTKRRARGSCKPIRGRLRSRCGWAALVKKQRHAQSPTSVSPMIPSSTCHAAVAQKRRQGSCAVSQGKEEDEGRDDRAGAESQGGFP